LKGIDWKILSELMKDSKMSDRELARKVGVSQPTVTRRRTRLENMGVIKEYTVIPDFRKLGFSMLALTFFRYENRFEEAKIEKVKKILSERLSKGPFEIIMAEGGMGAGYNAIMISIHRDYHSYRNLMDWAQQFHSLELGEIDSFLISLSDEVHYLPLTFSSLAEYLLRQKDGIKKE
jgi:DNA-binding Lrp family transcriptional regulator